MRSLRRLPPFLRVVNAIGLLLLIAPSLLNLQLNPYWTPFNASRANFGHMLIIAANFAFLGVSFLSVVAVFNTRLRQPGRRWRIPLDSWQSQARAVALAVAAPLGGLIINLATPPSFNATYALWVVMFIVACWPVIVTGLLG